MTESQSRARLEALRKASLTSSRVKLWGILGSRQVWNWKLAVQALYVFLLLGLVFDCILVDNFSLLWLPVWITTYIGTVLLVALILRVLPATWWDREHVGRILNFSIAAFVIGLKNSVVHFLASNLGLMNRDWDPLERIAGGAVLGVALLFGITGLSVSTSAHRTRLAELLQINALLVDYQERLPGIIASRQQSLIEQTQHSLLPRLAKIESSLQGTESIQRAVSGLTELIQQRVRPLSRKVMDQGERAVQERGLDRLNVDIKPLPQYVSLQAALHPGRVSALVTVMTWFTSYVISGPIENYWLLVAVFLVMLCELQLAKRLLQKSEPTTIPKAAIRLFGILLITAISVLLVEYMMFGPDHPQLWFLLLASSPQVVVVGFFFGTINVLDQHQETISNQINEANQKLEKQIRLADQAIWLDTKNWSLLLHGNIQSRLTASLAKLKRLEATSDAQTVTEQERLQILDSVRRGLGEIGELISSSQRADLDWRGALVEIQDTWLGAVSVTTFVETRAGEILDSNSSSQEALVEICREATTNAFRHGQATTVRIDIFATNDSDLEIVISNNGLATFGGTPSLGSKMLDSLCLEWSLGQSDGTKSVVLRAVLPVSNRN